jgi:transaldolase
MSALRELGALGQAVWLDDIHRDLITGGDLRRLIEEDGLRGMTSNPAIFKKAISDRSEYDAEIRELRDEGKGAGEIFEGLAVKDVQMAADVFRGIYDQSKGEHGFVSLEVNPHLALDVKATVEEGRRLWGSLNRPNVFVKVPATREGLLAIEQLISEGINVNVTLLFGLPRYGEVVDSWLKGLERRVQEGRAIEQVRSVASFFLSRVDLLVDPKLEPLIEQGGDKGKLAGQLRGEVAIASAKVAYQMYREMIGSERWKALARKGGRPQWLLWASTSAKNPEDDDLKYVEPLVGAETINTMPMETLEAYRDHGKPELRLERGVDRAREVLGQLPGVGVDIDEVTQQLEEEGLEKFRKPFDELMETLKKEMSSV